MVLVKGGCRALVSWDVHMLGVVYGTAKNLNFAGRVCGSGIEPQAAVAAGMRAAAVGSLTPTHSQHLAAFNAELDRIAVDLRVQQRAGACDRP